MRPPCDTINTTQTMIGIAVPALKQQCVSNSVHFTVYFKPILRYHAPAVQGPLTCSSDPCSFYSTTHGPLAAPLDPVA